VRHAARAVKEGLPPDAAVRALTINAARIAGVAERLGSIEPGKIANIIVTEGDLFDEKMRLRHVFVDGRRVPVEEAPEHGSVTRSGRSSTTSSIHGSATSADSDLTGAAPALSGAAPAPPAWR
jgi:adenine deaminase